MPRHLFKKGEPRPTNAGRRPGSVNKTTAVLKTAILDAAAAVGFDPRYNRKKGIWKYGPGGLQGYLEWVACVDPKAYTTLLGRVLPLQITGEGGGPLRVIDESMSGQEAASAYAEMLKSNPPPMIDVTPNQPKISGSLPRYKPAEKVE